MQIGNGTQIPAMYVTWPHQVSIGNNCILEQDIYFKFDGIHTPGPSILIGNNVFIGAGTEFNIRKKITIGDNCLVASGCRFVDHDHGIDAGRLMREQQGPEFPIVIDENVWIGCNVIILKGVHVGTGAVIAAGSVVTKDVKPFTMVAGVPATYIRSIK